MRAQKDTTDAHPQLHHLRMQLEGHISAQPVVRSTVDADYDDADYSALLAADLIKPGLTDVGGSWSCSARGGTQTWCTP